ncbi:zinc ribbon domain-containing protein [Leptospira ognonensis]|uniref:Zinc ribbon domain-containing protein n=1 Tax=Leptospira ognonensis TaxID=2484945 RepID=A0A4R9K1X2_9LEPT|nr:zinc ribbon domain-containing protein [Leptospira ognonensis]TGL59719.1 zinc ribbon domain-containing protein [Leptospira ognonensis]
MATYDYSCKTCGKQFEHVQSMKDDALTECLCGKKGKVERMITGTAGIIFKGTGFYVTDYKKSDSKSESSSLPPASAKSNEATPVAPPPQAPQTPSQGS